MKTETGLFRSPQNARFFTIHLRPLWCELRRGRRGRGARGARWALQRRLGVVKHIFDSTCRYLCRATSYTCIHLHTRVCTYVRMYVWMCVCICMYLCMHACMYVYVYVFSCYTLLHLHLSTSTTIASIPPLCYSDRNYRSY